MLEVDAALVVIPVPLESGAITYTVARLLERNGEPFAKAMAPVDGSAFAPPREISLSRYSLARIRAGGPGRPDLYLYEGMILPPPHPSHSTSKT